MVQTEVCLDVTHKQSTSVYIQPYPPLLTQPQYIFIHDAILEALECGVTEVAARDLRDQYKRLGVIFERSGKTALQTEYEVIVYS